MEPNMDTYINENAKESRAEDEKWYSTFQTD